MAEQAADQTPRKAGFKTLVRFLPLLWPRGEAELKVRATGEMTLLNLEEAAREVHARVEAALTRA